MPGETRTPSFDLTGKTAVVTGGTKGLGFGIAAVYAQYGANVVITARTAAEVEASAAEIGARYTRGTNRCVGVTADSGKQGDIDRVVAETLRVFGKLDILVNNAGISGRTAAILSEECDGENFDRVIATNLKGVFLFAKAAAKQMAAQGAGGKILNMASVGGLIGGKGLAAYGAAKAGVISLTKTMANEFARYGITVNAICPGYVVTPLNEAVFADADVRKKLEAKTALRRLGTIEEIAGPALALVSDCFGYMTGTYLLLDGGQTIGG
ncbi:MAG: glucose 1-dehydrogenase [Oscillospiraceae bacterium]|jgi:NAD(P)-dependent dehydrogenase (short-subunit alcohol dehydrogenase family)|nr:glucose 1-dehydrogenase [Oscillospiraceae bacterium]